MVSLEWDPHYVPIVKLGLHIAQIVISFVVWCLEIAVFRGEDARIVGNNGWTFGVCFLSIPAWLFLIMTPRWERTRRFAEPHAMLVVDVLFAIIWLSAFATQAAYNTAGMCGKVCNLSRAIVGLGVINTLMFAASSAVSAYTVQYYNHNGDLPGYDSRQIGGGRGDNIDPDKAAFSMAPHDDEAYERVNMDDHEAAGASGATYGGSNPYAGERYDHAASNPYSAPDDRDDDPNRYGSVPPRIGPLFDSETEYNASSSAYGANSNSAAAGSYGSNTRYDGAAQFPDADYDRIHR